MSDLNPPSQNKPGLLPSRTRTATVLSGNESTVTDARQASFVVAWTGTSGAAILVRKTLANARGNRYRCIGKVHRFKALLSRDHKVMSSLPASATPSAGPNVGADNVACYGKTRAPVAAHAVLVVVPSLDASIAGARMPPPSSLCAFLPAADIPPFWCREWAGL